MKTENLGITTLRTQTKLYTTDEDKAQAFNEQFQSFFFFFFFSWSSSDNIPDKGPSSYPSISHLKIHEDGVTKQLLNLISNESKWPRWSITKTSKISCNGSCSCFNHSLPTIHRHRRSTLSCNGSCSCFNHSLPTIHRHRRSTRTVETSHSSHSNRYI